VIIKKKLSKWLARFVARHPDLTGSSTLNGRLARWYRTNNTFRFESNTILELRSRNICGYGTQPVGRVIGRDIGSDGDVGYLIQMTEVVGHDYFDWANGVDVPDNARRMTTIQLHSKWNVEHHFRRTDKQIRKAYIAA
jgi:hypothetical protein